MFINLINLIEKDKYGKKLKIKNLVLFNLSRKRQRNVYLKIVAKEVFFLREGKKASRFRVNILLNALSTLSPKNQLG